MGNMIDALKHIDPAGCSYQEWAQVGMALKHEGFPVSVWDDWSAQDATRYHAGECVKKWESFREEAMSAVTGGTVYFMAQARGWQPPRSADGDDAIPWDATLTVEKQKDEEVIIDKRWLEGRELHEPEKWQPAKDLITYLETLFQPEEYIGYCVESWQRDENSRFVPAGKGIYTRTAGSIIEQLKKYGDDIGASLGDYNQECGGWIRFNPLDGHGVKNANVTDFRYALIESDSISCEVQNEILRKLELPIACMVHSGKKSIHAIVHIDANGYDEYRKRVDYLYRVCEKNGLQLDKQNRNPSRLSRLPGLMRAGKKQWLIAVNIGKQDFQEWKEWFEEQNDDLPDFENLDAIDWNHLPPLADPLIDNLLRKGHKMLLSGPSKAGKSFLQIELAIAIGCGGDWMGWKCQQGRVIYVNFELDRPSCLHRFADVYNRLKIPVDMRHNVEVWNLRGKSLALDKLAPKLIRRAKKINPVAVILDPIYKVITGDENSAEQMAMFCNQFDKIANEVGCAAIYCHHHSKGAQGGKKAMDRASGSGVFARDPDALLDLIELPLKPDTINYLKNKYACAAIAEYLDGHKVGWRNDVGPDDLLSQYQLMEYVRANLDAAHTADVERLTAQTDSAAKHTTAWRVSCTLREFEKPDDKDIYFRWPIHTLDNEGVLKDIRPDVEVNGKMFHQREKSDGSAKKEKAERERQEIIDAYEVLQAEKDEPVTVRDFVERSDEFFGKELKRNSMYKKIRKYGDFEIEEGKIKPVDDSADNDEED